MRLTALFPIIVTARLDETEAFYLALGFSIVRSSATRVQLDWPGSGTVRLDFIQAGDHTRPAPFQAPFAGPGFRLGIAVEDIRPVEAAIRRRGFPVEAVPAVEDGERRLALTDPNGLTLEFVGPDLDGARDDRLGAEAA